VLAALLLILLLGASVAQTATASRSSRHGPNLQRGCVLAPARCGYPAPSNTGVPRRTVLTRSHGFAVTTAGRLIRGLDVTGSIEVDADNVTIEDTRVTNASPGGHAVWIAPGVHGTVIKDSWLRGADHSHHSIAYAVQNSGSDTNRGIRLRMDACTECWSGPGTLSDSYAASNATFPGAHYESIYYGGGSGRLRLIHNTLVNPHGQTAVVFAGNDYGNQTGLTIIDNLLNGGGFVIYGGAVGKVGATTRNVTITGNRFGRCLTRAIYNQRSGGTACANGPDRHGYWPNGGYFGVSAYVNSAVTKWSGNYWDDNLAPVRA
jgi:hypothetical protein